MLRMEVARARSAWFGTVQHGPARSSMVLDEKDRRIGRRPVRYLQISQLTAKLSHTPCRPFGRADSIAPRIPPDQPLRPLAVESLRAFVSLSCGEFHRRGDSLKGQSKRNLKIKTELRDQHSKKVPKREPNKQRLPRALLLEPAWKEKDTTWSKSCGASWVDKGSKHRARKATPTSRMALGTGMEAKCNNMEQKAKTYCVY